MASTTKSPNVRRKKKVDTTPKVSMEDFILDNNQQKDKVIQAALSRFTQWFDDKTINAIIQSVWEYAHHYVSNKQLSSLIETTKYTTSIFEDKIDNIVACIAMYDTTDEQGLLWKLKNNQLNISRLPTMKPYEMAPSKYKELLARNRLIEEKKSNIATTTAYKCYKCNNNKCTVAQVQTRSADEPMTIFVTCQVCGFVFRQ